MAQDAPTTMLEEIVVTATRRAESVQDIPINISAFSGGELEQQRIYNLRQFARYVPGLTVVDQGPRTSSPIIIRGLHVDDLTAAEAPFNSGGDTVATYFGEVPVYIDLDLVDIDRVEVLRGPQGTLFGANSLGGAVRFLPKKPDTEAFAVEAHGQFYSIDDADDLSYQADLMVNAPFADNWAFRGVVSYRDQAGWIDQPFVIPQSDIGLVDPEDPASFAPQEDTNDWQRTTFRGSLLWDITENGSAQLTYNYQKDEVGGRQVNHTDLCTAVVNSTPPNPPVAGSGPPLFPAGCSPSEFETVNVNRVLEANERENQIIELDIIWDFGFAEFTSATGFTSFEEQGQRDQTDLLLTFEYTYGTYPAFTAFTLENEETDRITQEFRLVSQTDGIVDWIGGFFYRDEDFSQTSFEFTPGYIGGPTSFLGITGPVDSFGNPTFVEYFQNPEDDFKEWAIFGEIGSNFTTDRFNATLGGRYFEVEDTFTQGFAFPICAIDVGACGFSVPQPDAQTLENYLPAGQPTSSTREIEDFFWKLNLSFSFTDDILGYFTRSEGYRDGGSNSIAECPPPPFAPGNVACGQPNELDFDPDTTTNYELGLKSIFLGNALLLNASLFFVEWDDVQVRSTSFSGSIPTTINGNKAETSGVELDLQWQIADNWRIAAGYSYTEAELAEDAPQLGGFDGDRLPGTPEHQGSLVVDYNRTLQGGLGVNVSYGATAQSDVFTKLGNGSSCCRQGTGFQEGFGVELPGFTIHNISFGVSGDRWDTMLYVNNLTSKYARTGSRQDARARRTANLFGAPIANAPTIRRNFQYGITPRTIGVDFRWRTQ
jgi:outer membrane receptor protein involved in Fe transport